MLQVWGAYIWRGLFLEFYGIFYHLFCIPHDELIYDLPSYGIIFVIDTGHLKIDFLSFSSHLLVHCICHHQ